MCANCCPGSKLPAGAGEPTLSHLLSHTAGWVAGNSAIPGEVAQALTLPQSRAVTAPGEFFHYSNVGYVVLGLAVAAATGRGFAESVRDLVLTPLGLSGALAEITGAQRAALCPGTVPVRDDAPWMPGDPLAVQTWVEPAGADGNIGASAAELLRFAEALAAPGAIEGVGWLPAAVARITMPTAPGGEEILRYGPHLAVDESRYGLGVNIESTGDGALLTHGGGMIGYGAFMIADPGRGVAVSALLSAPGERPYAELLARAAHAAVLEDAAQHAVPEEMEPSLGAGTNDPGAILPGAKDPFAEILPDREPLAPTTESLSGLSGCYRSYTPWCPHFEIGVSPGRVLVLRAYSGVEAPTEDTPLVPIGGDAVGPSMVRGFGFRVGEDPRLPERLIIGDVIDGVVQTFDLDGCCYARVGPR